MLDRESEIHTSLLLQVPTTTPFPTTQRTSRTTTTAPYTGTGRTLPTLTSFSTSTPTTDPEGVWENPRLPERFVPISYDLRIRAYNPLTLNESNTIGFEGSVDIVMSLTTQTNYILLHAHDDLEIRNPVQILGSTFNLTIPPNNHRHVKNDFYFIRFFTFIPAGNYTLRLNFRGFYDFYADNTGMFYSTYYEDSKQKYIFLT